MCSTITRDSHRSVPELATSFWRLQQLESLALGTLEDDVTDLFGQVFPRCFQAELVGLGQRIHQMTVPVVRVVREGVPDEAALLDTSVGVWDKQVRVCLLVGPESSTRSAGRFRVVEHEEFRTNVPIHVVSGFAAEFLVEGLPGRL
jgi:hypothetical protein